MAGSWSWRVRALGCTVAWLVALAVSTRGAPNVVAASSQVPTTFAQLISGMKLVVVGDPSGTADTGVTYRVDAWLKGTSANVLSFGPDRSPVEPGWTRVVVAFGNPTNDDAAAPTIVWHVGTDGTIDPEGYQQYPGLPKTLAAMLAYFEVSPSTSLPPLASPMPPSATPTVAPTVPAGTPARSGAPLASAPESPQPVATASDSSMAVLGLLVAAAIGLLAIVVYACPRLRDR